jgi:hypothetical protein
MTVRWAWLYSQRVDLAMLGVPVAFVAAAAALSPLGRDGDAVRLEATWLAQFVLGNSTHVILTYLLAIARPDFLRATRGQAATVIGGALATFAVGFGAFALSDRVFSGGSDFVTAVALVFATHHTVSQVRGVWSLYGLAAERAGTRAPSGRERSMQRSFVPVALLLVVLRLFFVEKAPGRMYPYVQAVPGLPAPLPWAASLGLIAAWLAFGGVLLREVALGDRSDRPASAPKFAYVTLHVATVSLTLTAPGWGLVLSSAIHGVEYFLLTARMLEPRSDAEAGRLPRWAIWPAMLLAMAPLFVIGLLNAPFTYAIAPAEHERTYGTLRALLNGVVLSHYFADAFLYRFRIPEVRRTALLRLGMS